jgi:hypothetical protein
MRFYVLLVGLAVSIFSSVLLPAKSFAATPGTNISTSPVTANLKVIPGHSVSTTLNVENNDATPITIQLQLQTFKPYGTSGQAQIMPAKPNSAFMSWVHFSKTTFVAQPGIWTPVKMTVTTPPTAALDYYYAVLVKPQLSVNALHAAATLKGYNAILVLLDAISPNAKPKLSVTSFSANHGVYEYLPTTFSEQVKNTGNVYLAPTGDVYISKSSNFTNTINTIPINATQGNVIPSSSRTYTEDWSNGFPVFTSKTFDGQAVTDKQGNPIEHLVWNFSHTDKFRFGKYYAKMVLVYNTGDRDVPVVATVAFWVIPWKIIGSVLAVIILSMIGLYVSGHKLADRTFKLSRKVRRK